MGGKIIDENFYEIEVAGIKRKLPLVKIADNLEIASFVLLGDTELTKIAAEKLEKITPECDYFMTAEAKGIPLAYELSRIRKMKKYIVARKSVKSYMKNYLKVSVNSITTKEIQRLYLDGIEAEEIKNKKIVLVDDVISTGQSILALEKLAKSAGAIVEGRVSILAEGEAADRDDIIFLEELPIFSL